MNENSNNSDWQPCAQGELGRMVDHLQARSRRAKVTRAATVVCAVGAVGLAISIAMSLRRSDDGLNCSQVVDMLSAYNSNDLDEDLMQKVSVHLKHCPECQQHYEEMHAPNGPTSKVTDGTTVAWLGPVRSD